MSVLREKNKKERPSINEMCHFRASTMSIMDFEGLGVETETEKEYDMPIDPVWESQQISTFTAWCNAHLRKADMKIDSFEQDFRSGLKLMKLLEIISGESLPIPDKGRMRFHKIANVNKALKFIENKGVKLASIGAEEIVDGNVKMTLGMIWTIILRFTIQDIYVEESSAKEGLLLWCKRKTNGYKNINITNFKNSFQNGLAFCALIHNHDSSLLDYETLSPTNPRQNLELAFATADKYLDIPQMLNVEDMATNVESDERSIMAYVSSYYHTFSRRDKVSTAVESLTDILVKKIDEKNNLYDSDNIARKLMEWLDHMIREFKKTDRLNEAKLIVDREDMFMKYKTSEKPQYLSSKLKLQYLCISQDIKKDLLVLINHKWTEMENLETKYQIYLSNERRRQDQISNLIDKFDNNFSVQKAWINITVDKLNSRDYETSNLCDLRKLKRTQETFLGVLGSHQTLTEKLVKTSDELRRLEYPYMESIDRKVDLIVKPWDTLGNLNEERIQNINKCYAALTQIDDLQLEFAHRSLPLVNWIHQSDEDLNDRFILHFVEEIKDLVTAHETFKATLKDAISEYKAVLDINRSIESILRNSNIRKIPNNPYTNVTMKDLESGWSKLQSSIDDRELFLKQSLQKQMEDRRNRDKHNRQCLTLLTELQSVINNFFNIIDVNKEDTNIIPNSVHDKKQRVSKLTYQLDGCLQQLQEIESTSQTLANSSSPTEDDEILPISWKELSTIHQNLNYLINDYVHSTKSSNKTYQSRANGNDHDKLEEYRECFKHFDKTNSGKLDSRQFHACLLSLGFALGEDRDNDEAFNDIMNQVDLYKTGYVTLDGFLNFMQYQYESNKNQGTRQQLQQAFQALANDKRYINAALLRQHLPPKVSEYCLKNLPPRSPQVTFNGDSESTDQYNTHLIDYSILIDQILQ